MLPKATSSFLTFEFEVKNITSAGFIFHLIVLCLLIPYMYGC